ncbi:hypothetical protein SLEP1_g55792 [Rubroshorea leprosula]|uniref:Uncharacterized protein n=1 Tax=Rubroshorea leprosula TaxID=152421 RepID=A0AAV5MHM2_9ROSI|nr:hypothetical protein SLEP1_g55792 [Rubroshorea leprosula]
MQATESGNPFMGRHQTHGTSEHSALKKTSRKRKAISYHSWKELTWAKGSFCFFLAIILNWITFFLLVGQYF